MLLVFDNYCNAIIIKAVKYWSKDRQIVQWNKRKRPEGDPRLSGQLIFNKDILEIQWGFESLFNKWC